MFDGDIRKLKNKLIGGKFSNEQTEYNGKIYDHTKLRWTCVADDVRKGKPGNMPKDKLLASNTPQPAPATDADGFMNIPDGAEEELPF